MNDTISERSKKILRVLADGGTFSRKDIENITGESRISIIRELAKLLEKGFVSKSGDGRATVYTITDAARHVILWDTEEYLAQEPDKRHVLYKSMEPLLFGKIGGIINTAHPDIEKVVAMRQSVGDTVTARKELERFVIELSWKSSKIEGNTYTLLDTERLILEAKEAQGHDHLEAVMILNHKKAFDYIWEHQKSFRALTVSKIGDLHELLVTGLNVNFGLRDHPVGITGTVYKPPASKIEISSYLRDIVDTINSINNPMEKALACLMLIPYLQPFEDGNKRTSRLLANAVLLAWGYPPLSYRSIDEQAYKGALLIFYEQGSVVNFRNLYLEQLIDSATNYYFPIYKK